MVRSLFPSTSTSTLFFCSEFFSSSFPSAFGAREKGSGRSTEEMEVMDDNDEGADGAENGGNNGGGGGGGDIDEDEEENDGGDNDRDDDVSDND